VQKEQNRTARTRQGEKIKETAHNGEWGAVERQGPLPGVASILEEIVQQVVSKNTVSNAVFHGGGD
jgi:hypothetical protein